MKTIQNKLRALRAEMKKQKLDAWYISGTDPHSSEYLPDRWQTRAFISGFTGSYGVVVVTMDQAALWTDTRYFIQAEQQLKGTGIQMKKRRVPDEILPEKWLCDNLSAGSKTGIDAQTISLTGFRKIQSSLLEKNISLVQTEDLMDKIWEGRPPLSKAQIFELELKYAGISRKEKQKAMAAELSDNGAEYHLLSMLDEIAWMYNLRGSDIAYNPVFSAFSLIGNNENFLFVDKEKLSDELTTILEADGVHIKNYHEVLPFLGTLKSKSIYLDNTTVSYALYDAVKNDNEIVEGVSLVSLAKARKNDTELKGFHEAMIKDGVALVEFHFWLKKTLGKERITEYTVGHKLKEFRSKQDGFVGESFPPIIGYKEHGAIVHLSVSEQDALDIHPEGILLFDSGGQYKDGTTDITRTVALGEVSMQQKTDYTLVLKGMIGLTLAKFPYGTKGCHLDILARKPLWENGMNYGHGTGHGVGHFLNVHEGPMAIRQEYNENLIEPGMVMSNEPAFYREGEYGIRTENMIVCKESEKTKSGRFLQFDTLTLCPIDTELIRKELMTKEEVDWINSYHEKVNNILKPGLHKKFHDFLDELTKAI